MIQHRLKSTRQIVKTNSWNMAVLSEHRYLAPFTVTGSKHPIIEEKEDPDPCKFPEKHTTKQSKARLACLDLNEQRNVTTRRLLKKVEFMDPKAL
ncbi:hypothetical protein VNO77_12154 [Canavalia gladiata]|uniref:Uncharacterized protein n=1 Tax=Canavalia gladiata TaxID=3824 RepID=A0AAN9LWE2_CANGL